MSDTQDVGIPQQTRTQNRMRLFRVFLSVVFFVVLPLQIYTQVLAFRLDYVPQLGDQFLLDGFYFFWKGIEWNQTYRSAYPEYFETALLVAGSSEVILVGLLFLYLQGRPKKIRTVENIHGSARWQTDKEVRLSGLDKHKGVYLGKWEEGTPTYLQDDSTESVLMFAPTGSGKGIGNVQPTLLTWMGSVVVLDTKRENWAQTAGWRKKHAGNHVFCLDLTNPERSCGFNPLAEIRLGTPYEYGDAQNIAYMICDTDGKGVEAGDHWRKASYSLITATILHIAIKTKQRKGRAGTLPDVARFVATFNDTDKEDTPWEEMATWTHRNGQTLELIQQEAEAHLVREYREKGSVASSINTYLLPYKDPVVAKNLSHSDFKVADLMNADKPVSLYIVLQHVDKDRIRPVVRLIFSQIIRVLCQGMTFTDGAVAKHYKHRLLLLLDEFPSLGKLPILAESLSYVRSFGIKMFIVVQDTAQIVDLYGKNESITSACNVQIATCPNKYETAVYLSKLTGDTTVVKESASVSRKKLALSDSSISRTLQDIKRPLMTPDEISRIPKLKMDDNDSSKVIGPGKILIFPRGQFPIYATQILYFLDEIFLDRAKVPAPEIEECLPIDPEDAPELTLVEL